MTPKKKVYIYIYIYIYIFGKFIYLCVHKLYVLININETININSSGQLFVTHKCNINYKLYKDCA